MKEGKIKSVLIYDYFELMFSHIFFAFNALESFVNEIIPPDFYYEKKIRSIYKAMSKESIEREINIEEKFKKVVCKFLNCRSISKDSKLWSSFWDLKDIRNRIVHVKTLEQHSLHPEHQSLWRDLLTENFKDYSEIAYKIIAYHFKENSHFQNLYWFHNNELKFE